MRRLIILIVMMVGCGTMSAQLPEGCTAKELLKKMPSEVVPLLSRNNVLDCIDFIEHDSPTEVTNKMGGKSEMTELSPSLASFFLTASNSLDIKVLTKETDDVLIYVINTFTTDSLDDSSVKVYDKSWKPAADAYQFRFPHPERYNSLKVSGKDDNMLLKEVVRPLLFEGEKREDRPDEVSMRMYVWNEKEGVYK